MAAAIPVISLGLTAFGAVQQHRAGRRAEQAARDNATAQRAEAQEEARRLRIEQQEQEALARATAAASGTGGVSTDLALNRMRQEHARELQWVSTSGESRARATEASGRTARTRGTAGAIGTLSGGLTTAYNQNVFGS